MPREQLEGDLADEYERLFRTSDVFDSLFEVADAEVNPEDLQQEVVYERAGELEDGAIVVRLRCESDGGEFTAANATIEDETVVKAEIRSGVQVGPLAGRGKVWTYEDGEIREGEWIS